MGSEPSHLHMLFFPYMAQGHMLPMVDIVKLFAARGARITILTTPVNAAIIRPTIDDSSIHLHIIPFPSAEFGLPDGCENRSFVLPEDKRIDFIRAIAALRNPFDSVLEHLRPDCVVSDYFLPWTYHVAAARGIPRLVFHGTNNFSLCASNAFERCREIVDKLDSFVLPGLPHRIEMLKTQVLDFKKLAGTPLGIFTEIFDEAEEVEGKHYGAVMNSFYELEPEYADQNRKVKGKTWNVGPVSLCNKEAAGMSLRGGKHSASVNECLDWLESKAAGSVVYMCFGSGSLFSGEQLREMALGLEEAGHPFVWVVRNEGDDWVPEGYEERIAGKGMVVRGWAPQLLILNHGAVGGFVSHCGWNSSLEGICAGLPMVTWPLYAEQFFNEKLLVEVLGVGVAVGSKVYEFRVEMRPVLEASAVAAAVRRVMGGGEEAEERRRRAKELGEMARRAVEKGGSSFEEIGILMEELMDLKKH
ncbi:scopoletin glucosyltransferase-like [Phalaenopsis equestris]|uniref:scopoletin glucosyltransferase-like n=1 Tax=Phalaenopsis equestris TaxID=78828 RepID=UPI0009E60F97|nr:scopoletin glucosyltransferase-like [Phalaenopsis equestris]